MIATPPISQKWKNKKPWIIRHIFFSFPPALSSWLASLSPSHQQHKTELGDSAKLGNFNFNFNLCIILAKFRIRISGYLSQISLVDDDRQSTYLQNWKEKKKKKSNPGSIATVAFSFWSSLLLPRLSKSLTPPVQKQTLEIRHNWYLKNIFCVFWRKIRPDSPVWVPSHHQHKTELGDPP